MCIRLGFGFLATFVVLPFTVAQESDRLILPPPVEESSRNPWPNDWENEFRARGTDVLQAQCADQKANGLGGRTYFENEKRAYGILMAHVVAGDKDTALVELQRADAQADTWHRHTQGIDYYACFTLKHQIRKYFLFGQLLEPKYRQRMYDGAKAWTEQEPLRRPHYAFVKAGDGWGPDVKNSWVDVRQTENLFLMRVTSVYLMAEETKNAATRQHYKETILRYAASLYRVGMGEWDSENYHGHSLAPLLNLYDFAKDPEVKLAAKACLDYLLTIGAVKYYRGAFNGPSNRDYNHAQPFGGSAACMLWLYFGDTPCQNRHFESDEVHVFTSHYRPPAAVVHLARKHFDRPSELYSSKPHYTASTTADLKSPPAYYETQFLGRTFQMGSLLGGTTTGKSAVNGFKITVWDDSQGAVAIQGVPGADPAFVGSALYTDGKVAAENRVGQNRNSAVWLVKKGDAPWVWVLPDSITVELVNDITFLQADRTWLALRPINATTAVLDESLTQQLVQAKAKKQWLGHRVLSSRGMGGAYCGIVVEVGETPEFSDYAAFQEAVLRKSSIDASNLQDGIVSYTSADGRAIRLHFADQVIDTEVWCNGKRQDWAVLSKNAFGGLPGESSVVAQPWCGGTLTVQAGGKLFRCSVAESGTVEFLNQ